MPGFLGKVVLVVDDSSSIRRAVRAILEKEGFTVREAGSEFGLFGCMVEYGIMADIILMDLTINETNGLELVKKVRNTEKFRHIPIIMLTQHSDRANVLKAKNLDVQDYIVKPINARLLVERMEKALNDSVDR
ncbi:MAG: response regulator [Clostridiaceae bacterium]|jgi:PleD family two-component response regulator|nr:response regulator [Clostridiaceae bacterium]